MLLTWILLGAAGAAVLNAAYSNIKLKGWKKASDKSGKMVNVNGHKIYMKIMGSNNPTVIIENAAASTLFEWEYIQNELSKHVRVVTYDRPGYGYSKKAETPRTSSIIADELYTALKKENIQGPYIIVAHSQGGLYANHFIRKHPGEVKGAVLLDPIVQSTGFEKELNPVLIKKFINKAPAMKMMKVFSLLGIAKLFKSSYITNIPDGIKTKVVYHYSSASTYAAALCEYENVDTSFQAVHKAGPFPHIPVSIIYHSAEKNIELMKKYKVTDDDASRVEELWERLIKEEYYNLSKDCRWIVAGKSTHSIHTQQPELVIEVVLDLIRSIQY